MSFTGDSILRRLGFKRKTPPLSAHDSLRLRMSSSHTLNAITDSNILVMSDYDLERCCADSGVSLKRLDLRSKDYFEWQDRLELLLNRYLRLPAGRHHKKLVEFYVSYRLTESAHTNSVLDVAGQNADYIRVLKQLLAPNKCFLNDIVISDTSHGGVEYLHSSADSIAVPDLSIDRISCHHSFEHFRGDADVGFCMEIQRILAVGGIAVIVPLFVGLQYWEVRNIPTPEKYDSKATLLLDDYSTLPGWGDGEAFARVYDFEALHRRVLSRFDPSRFRVTLFAVSMDGLAVPRMAVNQGTHINYPMRAIQIERLCV